MPNYDVILGKAWMEATNPETNWRKNVLQFVHQGKLVHLTPNLPNSKDAHAVISAAQATRMCKSKKTQSCLLLVRPVMSQSATSQPKHLMSKLFPEDMDPALLKVLNSFEDVFGPVPPGLPPARGIDHRIELTPGSAMISHCIYPMSEAELQELKNQLQEMLDKGHI